LRRKLSAIGLRVIAVEIDFLPMSRFGRGISAYGIAFEDNDGAAGIDVWALGVVIRAATRSALSTAVPSVEGYGRHGRGRENE